MEALSLSDEELVQRFVKGSLMSFDELLARYETPLYQLIIHLVGSQQTTEDILKELFVVAFAQIGEAFEDVHSEPGEVRCWLFRQALRLSATRAEERCLMSIQEIEKERLAEDLGEDIVVSLDEAIQKTIPRLPLDYRLIFVLWDICGLPCEEVAAIAGITSGEVRLRIQRARLMVRRMLVRTHWSRAILRATADAPTTARRSTKFEPTLVV